jgi:uncharacterized Zn finger protein
MQTDIRKLSVGKDYPDGAMHFQVGKDIKLQGVPYEVAKIKINEEYKEGGKIAYDVYLKNESGTVLWKTVCDLPLMVENNINFE